MVEKTLNKLPSLPMTGLKELIAVDQEARRVAEEQLVTYKISS